MGGCWTSGTPRWLTSAADWIRSEDAKWRLPWRPTVRERGRPAGPHSQHSNENLSRDSHQVIPNLLSVAGVIDRLPGTGQFSEMRVSQVLGFKHNTLHKRYHMFVKAVFKVHCPRGEKTATAFWWNSRYVISVMSSLYNSSERSRWLKHASGMLKSRHARRWNTSVFTLITIRLSSSQQGLPHFLLQIFGLSRTPHPRPKCSPLLSSSRFLSHCHQFTSLPAQLGE